MVEGINTIFKNVFASHYFTLFMPSLIPAYGMVCDFSVQDCQQVERQGEPIAVDQDGYLWLSAASPSDAGKYTCLVEVSWNGRKYMSARSIQLTVNQSGWDIMNTIIIIIIHAMLILQ